MLTFEVLDLSMFQSAESGKTITFEAEQLLDAELPPIISDLTLGEQINDAI